MSSKTKTTATKEEATPALVPKLRFPEFRGTWEAKRIETLGYFTGGGTPSKENASYWAGDIPWISSSDLTEDSISQINVTRFITKQAVHESPTKMVPVKSILLISRVGVGKLAVSTFPLCTSQDFTNFTPTTADPLFLAYLLKSRKETLLSFNQGTSIKGFTKDNIANLELGFPSSAEQQKIAECLSSVDELIAAQARKLDALKTHKKGLMQQLFPREGETQPRLRFPEFRNAGEWKSDSLGEIFETSTGGTPSRSTKEYWNGGIPWITTSLVDFHVITEAEEFISPAGVENSSAKLFPKGTVLMALYGQGKTRGQVALLGIEAATNQACAAILPRSDIDPYFVFLNLAGRYEELRALSNAGGQENLSQGLIREIPFSFPSDEDEQRTVTSCLSSLDDLIAAETQKQEALKTHKKGLMQQLFPSPEEVGV
jgi:type I restriction enzyme S subunit